MNFKGVTGVSKDLRGLRGFVEAFQKVSEEYQEI